MAERPKFPKTAPRYASIDVGSNTVRLLIVERNQGGSLHELRRERRITRLGGDFTREGKLDERAMLRTLTALKWFADLLSRQKVGAVFAVATGVVREAKNGNEWIAEVLKKTGISLRLISGEEEGRLMLRGVQEALRTEVLSGIFADIGGWSTEILWVEGDRPRKTRSLELGVVALCERFLKSDPPAIEELKEMEDHAERGLMEAREWFRKEGLELSRLEPRFVGTAGTMTTLAAIDQKLSLYDPRRISGHRISCSTLREIYQHLRVLPLEGRREIPGVEVGREDLIIAGAGIALSILKVFEGKEWVVIDSGLLEGVLLEGISRLS